MADIVPCEEVRADELREGDRVWFENGFGGFDVMVRTGVSVILRDETGMCLLDALDDEIVLRQAVSASRESEK